MHRRTSVKLVGIGIAVFVFAFIVWMGVRETASPPPAAGTPAVVVGTSVFVVAPPLRAQADVPVPFTWSVQAPIGATATHTAIHWGTTSNPVMLGADVAPAAAGYLNLLPTYAAGSFALPREFTGAVTFPARGTYVYRAHAIVGGAHVWSPEYSIRVE